MILNLIFVSWKHKGAILVSLITLVYNQLQVLVVTVTFTYAEPSEASTLSRIKTPEILKGMASVFIR